MYQLDIDLILRIADYIITWAGNNELLLGLLASAIIGSMPEHFPTSWRQVPQFLWAWMHDAGKMFLNFRRGGSGYVAPPQQAVTVEFPKQEAPVQKRIQLNG